MNDYALYEAARARMDAGAYEEATALFKRSIEIEPHFKALELLGECYVRLGQMSAAVVPLAAATALNRQARAPSMLAEVFESLGDLERAAAMASNSLERDPNNRRAQAVLQRTRHALP